jgi:hypothetical protein
MGAELKAELNGPNVLTLGVTVDMVGATAIPNPVTLGDYVESVTRLRANFVSLSV